mmetsp:Transcript_25982/g.65530  ORF Transcript_25982/g.65530 Transcript_25982/m.65530 type:complete len:216 (-) Transcript_25982:120-767(-)
MVQSCPPALVLEVDHVAHLIVLREHGDRLVHSVVGCQVERALTLAIEVKNVCHAIHKGDSDVTASREEDRWLAELVHCIDIGLVKYQKLHQTRLVLIGSRVQRANQLGVLLVDVSLALQQRPGKVHVRVLGRQLQGKVPSLAAAVGVSLGIQEKIHLGVVVKLDGFLDRQAQQSPSLARILERERVGIDTVFQQLGQRGLAHLPGGIQVFPAHAA